MTGVWVTLEPVIVAVIGVGAPLLTLWFARRDKRVEGRKTQGQQFVDNIVSDNKTLRTCVEELEAEKAKLESDWRAAVRQCEGITGKVILVEWAALQAGELLAASAPMVMVQKHINDVLSYARELRAQVQ